MSITGIGPAPNEFVAIRRIIDLRGQTDNITEDSIIECGGDFDTSTAYVANELHTSDQAGASPYNGTLMYITTGGGAKSVTIARTDGNGGLNGDDLINPSKVKIDSIAIANNEITITTAEQNGITTQTDTYIVLGVAPAVAWMGSFVYGFERFEFYDKHITKTFVLKAATTTYMLAVLDHFTLQEGGPEEFPGGIVWTVILQANRDTPGQYKIYSSVAAQIGVYNINPSEKNIKQSLGLLHRQVCQSIH